MSIHGCYIVKQLGATIPKWTIFMGATRPGKQPHNYGKIHHFAWENQLFRLGHFPYSYVSHYQRV